MSLDATPIVPVAELTRDMPKPLSGSPVNSADLTAVAQVAANRTATIAYVYLGLTRQDGSIGIGQVVAEVPWLIANPSGPTHPGYVVSPFYDATIPTGSTGIMWLGFVPHGVKLRTIALHLIPANHASIAGLTLPSLALVQQAIAGGAPSTWTTTDPSGSAAAYSAAHDLALDTNTATLGGGAAHGDVSIDRTAYVYGLQFVQEHGGGNAADGTILQPRILLKEGAP